MGDAGSVSPDRRQACGAAVSIVWHAGFVKVWNGYFADAGFLAGGGVGPYAGPVEAPDVRALPPVVGFDLDMTLVDTRDRITASLRATLADVGVHVSDDDVWPWIGPPLHDTLAALAPGHDAEALVAAYRARHDSPDAPDVPQLPGAADALAAVRGHGGRTVVVSAKVTRAVELVLRQCGLADAVHVAAGGLFGTEKATVLRAEGAVVYVGDHPGDVAAARAAGATSVAVPTGPHGAESLRDAGADVVLPDLRAFPAWLDRFVLDRRVAALQDRLRGLGSVLVAFSGGADSALLLAAAVRTLGPDHVMAGTGISDSLPAAELDDARAFARRLGVRMLTPRTHELEREGYRANAGDRCYHCKSELLDVLVPLAGEHGLAHVATGTNADDVVAGFRPGIGAAAERGAVTPLADAGLTKAQVRAVSRAWELPTWDKPAAACLSSRVAFGTPVTRAGLARVEAAEAGLRSALADAGIEVTNLRVRDLGDDRARIEVDTQAVDRVTACEAALARVEAAGFGVVDVDPRGFRSGSMNDLLVDPQPFR